MGGLRSYLSVGVGIGISSEGVGVSPTALGGFSLSSARISISDYTVEHTYKNYWLPIPFTPVTLNYSYTKRKWYLKYLSSNIHYGPIYYNDIYKQPDFYDYHAKQYINMDIVEYASEKKELDEEYENLIALPAYDAFHISAQGLNGNMSARRFEEEAAYLIGTGIDLKKYPNGNIARELDFYFDPVEDKTLKTFDRIQFYFDYINSSSLHIDPNSIISGGPGWHQEWDEFRLGSGFVFNDVWNEDGTNTHLEEGYNKQHDRLITGNSIEWFTNEEIISSLESCQLRGFIETNSILQGNRRDNIDLFDPDGIGAFTIVKSDGLRYHYSLPVYQFEMFQKTSKANDPTKFNTSIMPHKYATHWLLTGITGPDYVDNGDVGLTDEDLGYWVKFDYGKWTDGYVWKKEKIIKDSKYLTWGRKQIYYLNSVETASHIAYFIKDVRKDALGCIVDKEVIECSGIEQDYEKYADLAPSPEPYSFQRNDVLIYEGDDSRKLANAYLEFSALQSNYSFEFESQNKIPVLKLNEIVLLSKNAENQLDIVEGEPIDRQTYNSTYFKRGQEAWYVYFAACEVGNEDKGPYYMGNPEPIYTDYVSPEGSWLPSETICFSDNVYDVNDIINVDKNKIKSSILFSYSNNLHPGNTNNASINPGSSGKLVLDQVDIKGEGGAKVMPPYKFEYKKKLVDNNSVKEDPWGFYSRYENDYNQKVDADYGSLTAITFPLGGKINIQYESDQYKSPIVQRFETSYYYYDYDKKRIDQNILVPLADHNLKFDLTKVTKVGEANSVTCLVEFKSDYELDLTNVTFNRLQIDVFTYGKCTHYPYLTNVGGDVNYIAYENGNYKYSVECEIVTITEENTSTTNPICSLADASEGEVITGIQTGSVLLSQDKFYGGGLRTKSIEFQESGVIQSSIQYDYPNLGITTQVPSHIESFTPYYGEIPAAKVFYDKVIVTNYGKDNSTSPLSTAYHFYLPDSYMNNRIGDVIQLPNEIENKDEYLHSSNGNFDVEVNTKSSVLKDNKSAWGRLMSIEVDNQAGDLVSKTEYDYFNMDEIPQGEIGESYKYARLLSDYENHKKDWYFSSIIRKQYPNVLKSVTKTSGGYSNTVTNTAWDPITGEVLETEFTNPNGDIFRSEKVPAYQKYDKMGSIAAWDGTGARPNNMLTQEAASYLYDITNGTPEYLAANVQTWKDFDGNNIWRKQASYAWKGELNDNGTFLNDGSEDAFDDFNWDNPTASENNGWQKLSEITRYNAFSTPIESLDIMGRKSAVQTNAVNQVLATASFSSVEEFEVDNFEESTSLAGIVTSPEESHTGFSSLKVTGGSQQLIYEKQHFESRDYLLSFWVKGDSHKLKTLIDGNERPSSSGGSTPMAAWDDPQLITTNQFGAWTLCTYKGFIPKEDPFMPSNSFKIFGFAIENTGASAIFVDDFRVYNEGSVVSSYVYNEFDELTAILDANNIATKYTYNKAGQLQSVEKETPDGFKKVVEYQMNYGANLFQSDTDVKSIEFTDVDVQYHPLADPDTRMFVYFSNNIAYKYEGIIAIYGDGELIQERDISLLPFEKGSIEFQVCSERDGYDKIRFEFNPGTDAIERWVPHSNNN
jgi:YD repeat-containing protein